jgi:hypothetical protein
MLPAKTQAVAHKVRILGVNLLREGVKPVAVDQRTRDRGLGDRGSRSIVTRGGGGGAVAAHSGLVLGRSFGRGGSLISGLVDAHDELLELLRSLDIEFEAITENSWGLFRLLKKRTTTNVKVLSLPDLTYVASMIVSHH